MELVWLAKSSIMLVLCIPSASCAQRKLPAIIVRNNMLDHKRNENVVCWKDEFSSG